ncbi:uncharacterized protein LOC126844829 [Adelges cooleyi]|uniref:uncharacterized protein LOC126844829 n=1 Tax=Adelges cooleyi TaxID=133065 RepID=UPI00217FA431|nr:uncharacterized protein LOC126844829 [Adelges cooleyi]
MAFKFSILILSFIIVVNFVPGHTEKKVLRKSYDFVREHYDFGFCKSEFLDFAGKDENLECVKEYWRENSVSLGDQDEIMPDEFMNLVYWICKKQGYSVQEFLDMSMRNMIVAAEVIHKAYNFTLEKYNGGEGIGEFQFIEFLGANNSQYVKEYWRKNSVPPKDQDMIYFKEFKTIVYAICTQRGFFVFDFLDKRMKVATKDPSLAVEISIV